MPDRLFADRRLAAVYDPLDPDRSDLEVYAGIVAELAARTVLDLGCGTGTFAVLLARRGPGGSASRRVSSRPRRRSPPS